MSSDRAIRSIDLFCGIGGLTLGLKQAGVVCLGGTDVWEDAGETFRANLPEIPFALADITKVTTAGLLSAINADTADIDLIVGGPPCQGFSTVGKRLIEDPRNSLWQHYLMTVEDIRPAYVIIENVEGLNVMQGGKVRDAIIGAFADIGYRMKSRVLVSAEYGVPQLRKRIVFFGWLPSLAEPQYPRPKLSRPEWVTVKDAIFDLPPLASGEEAGEYGSAPQTPYQQRMRGGSKVVRNHAAANHPAHLVEILSHIPDGGNRKSIPENLQPKSGFHNSYARLASNKPAIAVTSNMRKPSSARATHPTQNRGLTVREGLRLQGFPDWFEVKGSRTSQYLQVGNAVPPILGAALGEEVTRAFLSNSAAQVAAARCGKAAPLNRASSALPVQESWL